MSPVGPDAIGRRSALRSFTAATAGVLAGGGPAAATAAASTTTTTSNTAPFVNVVDHGATGDGASDDTAAIRAALATLTKSGGCVYFPPGTYLISDSLTVDYATTLLGANPAASILKMSATVLEDMIVGGPSFPVRINLVNMTFDGGLTSQARGVVPTGTGTLAVGGPAATGVFADTIRVSGGTCALAVGDVVRTVDQPVIVVTDTVEHPVRYIGATYVCNWSPATPIQRGQAGWQVFKTGNIISGCGRLVVDNCVLVNAKRHAVDLSSTTQGNFHNCEIGGHQGCAIFARSATDFAISDSWFFGCGGPHIYLAESVDVRLNNSILEGSGSYNVYAEQSELEVSNCGLWGGRGGLIYAHKSAMIKLAGLKLREPGYGVADTRSFAAAGFAALHGRAAVDTHFSAARYGLQAMHCTLHDADSGTGPIFRIANGSRSNLAGIEWDPTLTFQGGNQAASILADGGTSTIVRGFRSVPDKN